MMKRMHTRKHKLLPPSEETISSSEVFSYALKRLLERIHSVKEIRKKLEKKFGTECIHISGAIERLQELGYLNDMTFAESLVRNRLKIKHRGFGIIVRELQEANIHQSTIQLLLEEHREAEDKSLAEAVEKKLRLLPPHLPQEKKYAKLFAYLQRRGYPTAKIHHILQTHLPRNVQ